MSSIKPVDRAIIAAVNATPNWITAVGANRMYTSLAPKGLPRPYGVIRDVTERDIATFGKPVAGFSSVRMIDLWSHQTGHDHCDDMYNALRDAIHLKDLILSTGRMVLGKCELVIMVADPAALTEHAVVRYNVWTRS